MPETHEIAFPASAELKEYLRTPEFQTEVAEKMKTQYVVEVHINNQAQQQNGEGSEPEMESLILSYTRNNTGGLKDAIDFLVNRLMAHGLDGATIKGVIPRPKSDSFEESLPFFESKLLHNATPVATDSPTRSTFGDDAGEQNGFFSRIRKPGSMSSFSSFMERRKNGSNSPGSLFKHASSNASKASLVSLESQGSGYRNPWNDSGINLPDEDQQPQSHSNGQAQHNHMNGHHNTWPLPTAARFDNSNNHKVPSFGSGITAQPGDVTPRYDPRASVDSGRPSTSHSANSGYPGPIGPPR